MIDYLISQREMHQGVKLNKSIDAIASTGLISVSDLVNNSASIKEINKLGRAVINASSLQVKLLLVKKALVNWS